MKKRQLTDENLAWESKPLIDVVESKQLMAFRHEGFWCAMDTLREKNLLHKLWVDEKAPWKTWL